MAEQAGPSAIYPADEEWYNLEEIEGMAKRRLPAAIFGYYASGADGENTLRDNRLVYARYRLMPRILVNVRHVDMSLTLLGQQLRLPILIAPMAMQRMAHPDGEIAVATAAAKAGTAMVLSTMSTTSMEDVAAAVHDDVHKFFFQLYIIKDKGFNEELLRRAEKAGYAAVMLTVDAPMLGNREADARHSFKLPAGLRLEHLEALSQQQGRMGRDHSDARFLRVFGSAVDDSADWEFIAWLKTATKLPIFVKGVLSAEDARTAVQAGVDGIVVSNHGGRQLDSSPAALDVVHAMRRAVGRRVPLLLDGGVRRGTDVLKALALGADAVLLGRPVLFGLALGGQEGVTKVLAMLEKEFRLAMVLAGCKSLRQITPSLVMPSTGIAYGMQPPSRL